MPSDSEILRRRGRWFIVFAFIFLCASFALAPLGGFFIWIFAGGTAYCVFYSVYNFVVAGSTESKAQQGNQTKRHRRETEKEREMREYIRRHLTILVSMMLGALLLVIIFWLVFS
jgi:hypothetical protein